MLQHAFLLSKNNFVQKTSKSVWSPDTFGTVFTLITRKNTGVYYISALSCHTAPVGQNTCWKQDQKYKTKTKTKIKAARPRPRPRPVWDQSCHKTAVSDPKTGSHIIHTDIIIIRHCVMRDVSVIIFNSKLWPLELKLLPVTHRRG